jgi:putative peptide zinc metalloprotease protein
VSDAPLNLMDQPVRLRPDVEVLTGAGGAPLLFNPDTGRYMRLGLPAADLVRLMDGERTGSELAQMFAGRHGAPLGSMRQRVAGLFAELGDFGALDGVAPRPRPVTQRLVRGLIEIPKVKFALVRGSRVAALLAPVVRLIWRVPPAVASVMAVAVAVAATVVTVVGAVVQGPPASLAGWPVAAVLMLVLMVGHELSHALVCQLFGVPAREIGVAFWYYALPVAYVDRTDAYRIRGRWSRVAISLAGPVHDMCWAAGATVVAVLTTGQPHDVATALAFILLFSTVFNFHPLLPTDGQQAAEAAVGELNLRGQAMSYLGHLVLRQRRSTAARPLSVRRRFLYGVYGAVCLLYVPIAIGLVTFTVFRAFGW